MTKVMVVDDHQIVRMGLRELISRHAHLELVGEAGSAAETLKKVPTLKPDIVILDVRLPDGSGVEVCRELNRTNPEIKIIMLTSFPDEEVVTDAILAGASGFVLKEIQASSLLEALEEVAKGKVRLDPGLTGNLFNFVRKKKENEQLIEQFSRQEENILSLVAEGKTNREIGETLFLSEKTVRNHLTRILRKLNLSNRTQVAAYYVRSKSF